MVLIHSIFANKESLPNSLQLLLGTDIPHVVGHVCSFKKFCIHNIIMLSCGVFVCSMVFICVPSNVPWRFLCVNLKEISMTN
jgi:hypothetical protein